MCVSDVRLEVEIKSLRVLLSKVSMNELSCGGTINDIWVADKTINGNSLRLFVDKFAEHILPNEYCDVSINVDIWPKP